MAAHEPLAKQYDPKAAQARWLQFWDDKNYFHSVPDASRTPYTIVIPPPNVTAAPAHGARGSTIRSKTC